MTEITDEARQMAADLANAEGTSVPWLADNFTDGRSNSLKRALARLCTRFTAMQKDMAEIDRLSSKRAWFGPADGVGAQISAIAAKYRVETDPLVEAIIEIQYGRAGESPESYAAFLRAALAKRGVTI